MRAQLRGLTLAYDDHPGPRPAVVLLHGFPLDRTLWHHQVAALAGQYRLIVPDLRGHGASEAVPGVATMDDFADDLAALLDHLGVDQVVLGGLSMGGYIAFAFWRRYRARVLGLVLVDTRAQADTEEGRRGREEIARLAEEQGAAAVAERNLPKLLAPATYRERPELVAEVRRMIAATPPAGIAAASRGMAERPDSLPTLATITVPVLVIVGAEDQLTPPADAELMAQRLPQAELVVVPGAGHLAPLEQPERVTSALRAWLERLR